MHPSIAVIGAGAVGVLATASLLDAGHTPTVCVRTPFDSMVLDSPRGRRTLRVPVVSDPARVGPVDWVLVTVKAQDTAGAAPWFARLVGPQTVVAALQNGVEHRQRLEPFVGGAPVLPVVVYLVAERVAPGRVVHHRGLRLVVTPGAHSAPFAQLFEGSEMEVSEEADLTTALWRKLLSNVAVNPLTALTMRRVDVMGEPGMPELGRGILTEALAAAQAEGARLGPADVDAIVSRYIDAGSGPTHGTSTYYDRLAGRPMEHDDINGAVVRAARRHGIATPLNDLILTLMRALDKGRQCESEPVPAPARPGGAPD
ncbi:MAG: 2-dehydropantoate 2-reductase [Acidimicrobiaceae bacterium]|nr:2-dehydropantoate 2-reductase [Acidimicrobiaceae bacterium]